MLGGISLTLVGVFAYGFKFVNMNRQVTLATQAAQIRVEKLRNTDYDSIPIVTGAPTTLSSTDYPFLFTGQGDCSLLNGQDTVSVTPGIDENLKRLEVTITWDFQGRHLRKDVITYIAKDGINRR
jgi:hypothetical protein